MTDTFEVQGEFAPAIDSFNDSSNNVPSTFAGDLPQALVVHADEAAAEAELPNGFIKLGLAKELIAAVADLGFTQPTTVQEAVIPKALPSEDQSADHKYTDLMVSSQTGSGKTAAFLLPVLHTLIRQMEKAEADGRADWDRQVAEAAAKGEAPPKRAKRKDPTNPRHFKAAAPGALIVCPTRELAQQVAHDAIDLVKHCHGIRVANVVGGMPYQLQIAKLQNANLVVATPGRLLDLQRSMQIKLDEVQFLVVDEADRMLDLGFSDDLAELNQLTIERQQTMMFSATFAPRIQQLATRVMRQPQRVQIDSPQEKHVNIKQSLFWADNAHHKRKLLDHWLRDTSINQAIVFASTQIECDGLANDLQQEGFSAVALHGALSQGLRNRRLMALRQGQVQILVATDVAARGIDVPTITHVFNFGLPMKAEDYTHRIGRTGRAGRDGLAITFAEIRDRRKIFDIEAYTRQPIKVEILPGLEPQQRIPDAPRARAGGREGAGGGRDGGGRDYGPRGGKFGGGGRSGGFGGGGGRFAGNDRGGDRFAPSNDRGGDRFAPGNDRGGNDRFAGGNDRFGGDRFQGNDRGNDRFGGDNHAPRAPAGAPHAGKPAWQGAPRPAAGGAARPAGTLSRGPKVFVPRDAAKKRAAPRPAR